jgi:hypothetical protein
MTTSCEGEDTLTELRLRPSIATLCKGAAVCGFSRWMMGAAGFPRANRLDENKTIRIAIGTDNIPFILMSLFQR